MGRRSGNIAAHATLTNGNVDLCILPEVPLVLDGPHGILGHLDRVLDRKGHAVVVLAEGAGEDLLGRVEKLIEAHRSRSASVSGQSFYRWVSSYVPSVFSISYI